MSLRETARALTTAFAAPSAPYPLPDELRATIESFLERYDAVDDHDSQRLHEEMCNLYQRHVVDDVDKQSAFLAVLRLLRPALTGEARWTVWWELLLKPTVDGIGYKRHQIEDAREILQSLLVYDVDADHSGALARLSKLFAKRVVNVYLARTGLPASSATPVSPGTEFVVQELESILVSYGRSMPKAFLVTIDDVFVQKRHRIQALTLLNAFVRLQPPHLHLILETQLLQHLEKCLLTDTSSTVIELALVVLIMFLPHICSTLPSDHHLAKLFLIYARVLCWDKLANPDEPKPARIRYRDQDSDSDRSDIDDLDQPWEQAHHSVEYPDSSPPTLMHFFTFLYGLFPLNFMAFVRKPRRYLKSRNFPGARDFDLDLDLIHSRTEPYRRTHLLHPNMFTTTMEDELNDSKWLKSDPADIVTECMDLCVAVATSLESPGPPPSSELPQVPDFPLPPVPGVPTQLSLDDDGATAVGSNTSWRNTQSTMCHPAHDDQVIYESSEMPRTARSVKSMKSAKTSPILKARDAMDSPTLPAKDAKSGALLSSPTTPVHKQPSLYEFANSVTGLNSPTHADFKNQTMASLQREIMLLRNDLNFERYLKQQHLTHIGQLQRKNTKEATAEADTQNLINTNRTLKARLAKANELYAQLKKETLTSRNQSKKWENELSGKVRTYKESEKAWQGDEDRLRFELQKTQSDYEHLKKIVEKAEAEQLKAQQRTRALEYELEDYGNVRRDLDAAQEKILTYEDQSRDLHALIQERNELRNDLEIANMRISSRELDRERSIKAYERRIMELETRLQMTERHTSKPGQLPSSVQQMLDSALAASNAKLQQLKKAHYRLLEQYTELEMKCQDLEAERRAEKGRVQVEEKALPLDSEKARLSRALSARQYNDYKPKYLPPISTEVAPSEEEEQHYEFQSPSTVTSPRSTLTPQAQAARPTRVEALQTHVHQRNTKSPSPYPGFGGSLTPDFSAAYDASLNTHFQASRAVQPGNRSVHSVDTEGSSGRDKKEKVDVKSEVRVYGRGGAQNIGKKFKDNKDPKKPSAPKTGGFRGLKGIM